MGTRTAYIAKAPLTVAAPDGTTKEIVPGEEVSGFEDWPNEAKHAALSLERVSLETIEDTPKKASPKKSAAKRSTSAKA